MSVDLDTFLVTVYTLVDDLYQAHYARQKPVRPGPVPQMSDSEVLTIALCVPWHGNSERALVRRAAREWRSYFPTLLSQSAFSRRVHDLSVVLADLGPRLAAELPPEVAAYQVVDTLPVPLARRCRGRHHKLFGTEASFGRGGADRDAYFGCQLLVTATNAGPITGWLLGPANTQERWLAEACFCWRAHPTASPWTPAQLPASHRKGGSYVGVTGPVGPRQAAGLPSRLPLIADRGFTGKTWQQHWATDYGVFLFTHASYHGDQANAARRQHSGWRQLIETVNSHLEGVFHLAALRVRSLRGLRARVATTIAAFNLGVLINRQLDRPPFAFATLSPF